MRTLTAFAAALMLCSAVAAPLRAETAATITVTGDGAVDARPDMATVSLGVTTQGATAAAAMADNSAQLAAVLERLRAAGIEERDLQTSGLSLNPNWQPTADGRSSEIVGYVASNMLTVRVRKLDGLGAVLDAAVTDGANTFNGLSFGLADPAPAMNEARRRAVADAMARAKLLTEAAGVPLGTVLSISEGGGFGGPVPVYKMDAAPAARAVPVAGGEVTTSASVTMVFAIGE